MCLCQEELPSLFMNEFNTIMECIPAITLLTDLDISLKKNNPAVHLKAIFDQLITFDIY